MKFDIYRLYENGTKNHVENKSTDSGHVNIHRAADSQLAVTAVFYWVVKLQHFRVKSWAETITVSGNVIYQETNSIIFV